MKSEYYNPHGEQEGLSVRELKEGIFYRSTDGTYSEYVYYIYGTRLYFINTRGGYLRVPAYVQDVSSGRSDKFLPVAKGTKFTYEQE